VECVLLEVVDRVDVAEGREVDRPLEPDEPDDERRELAEDEPLRDRESEELRRDE
jgi:hypothetical protein